MREEWGDEPFVSFWPIVGHLEFPTAAECRRQLATAFLWETSCDGKNANSSATSISPMFIFPVGWLYTFSACFADLRERLEGLLKNELEKVFKDTWDARRGMRGCEKWSQTAVKPGVLFFSQTGSCVQWSELQSRIRMRVFGMKVF